MNIIIINLFLISFFLSSAVIRAEDTLVTRGQELIINSNRLDLLNKAQLVPKTIIRIKEEKINLISFDEILSGISGLTVKNYGGAGGLKTISIRGTNSQQTAISIEGFQLNAAHSGSFDLTNIPLNFLSEAVIIHGGISALYGGGSIGGAINLKLIEKQDSVNFHSQILIGSFGEFKLAAIANCNINKTNYGIISASVYRSKGNYPVEYNNYSINSQIRRTNCDITDINLLTKWIFIGDRYKLSPFVILQGSERGCPGPVIQNNPLDSTSRLFGREMISGIKYEKIVSEPSYYTISGMWHSSYLKYESKFVDSISEYNTNDFQVNTNYFYNSERIFLNLCADARLTAMNSNKIILYNSYVIRKSAAVLGFIRYSENNNSESMNWSTEAAIRQEYIPDYGYSISPFIGIGTNYSKILNIFLSWSYNFRPPSFNELYYLNFGTKNLQPERSNSFNLTFKINNRYADVSLSPFLILTKNQIISVPKSPVAWSAQNIGQVLTRGFEYDMKLKLPPYFVLIFNYTYQIASDQSPESAYKGKDIVYIPRESAGFELKIGYLSLTADLNIQRLSYRYSYPDNDYSSMLPAYFQTNLSLKKNFNFYYQNIGIVLQCNNLSNENYDIVRNYPMPGRSFRFIINYN
ncbi:MAG: TonB-dependent receptor [Candidatus Kapabacteria bacterium]|nr:TonB-dependent receptor [Candidatus Kapabacteria bacterium]